MVKFSVYLNRHVFVMMTLDKLGYLSTNLSILSKLSIMCMCVYVYVCLCTFFYVYNYTNIVAHTLIGMKS